MLMSVDPGDQNAGRGPVARLRRLIILGAVVMGAVAMSVGLAPGVAGAVIDPTQSIWTSDFTKDLKDPTLTYTQHVNCSDFTPGGQSTLYPYTVPEGGEFSGRYAYRNHSSSGVTVTVNPASTSDANGAGLSFFVTSLHISGNYAFKMSIECQSNDWLGDTGVSAPSLTVVGSTGAMVGATLSSSIGGSVDAKYYVQYGTQYARYTSQSPPQTTTLGSKASSQVSIALTGLQPATTYHYRVVMIASEFNVGTFTNYSGADQTFTTGPVGPQTVPRTKPHATKLSRLDQAYLKYAIQTDRAQISLGKLALATSRDRAVRRLARRTTTDHRLLLQNTVSLARKLHARVPRSPAPTQVRAARLLSTLSGNVFNHRYASLELRGTKEAIRRAGAELRGGQNATILHIAKVALPILRVHLRLARAALTANP
jgi:predicted outer membrane protein